MLLNDSFRAVRRAYNEGDIAPHEVGHWLLLLHTFENGCTFPGDEVPDTAYQLDGDNIFECDEALGTCAQPGDGVVHNSTSYGHDATGTRSPGLRDPSIDVDQDSVFGPH